MRILAFGDLQMSSGGMRNIPGIDTADLLIINGDLTNHGSRKEAKEILNEILSINLSILVVPGNLDSCEINNYLEELNLNLHGQACIFRNKVCLIGIGRSNISFRTQADFSEDEISAIGRQTYNQALELKSLAESLHHSHIPVILVTHEPPHGTRLDRQGNGSHAGSMAIRLLIERHQPDVCITGHIHGVKGADIIGRTTVISPGMFRQGGWVDIRINKLHINATLQ